ncbi:MAG: hypothetical protein LH615_07490 [Ferruginibacter sp.]|nr:hypothetical protein [Ferruginibacter sp.]
MKVENIVFGPNDLARLLTADQVTPIYRMKAELTMDDTGVISAITAYPVDANMQEITAEEKNYRIKGCQQPPGCMDIH